jgi:hypothetical protein
MRGRAMQVKRMKAAADLFCEAGDRATAIALIECLYEQFSGGHTSPSPKPGGLGSTAAFTTLPKEPVVNPSPSCEKENWLNQEAA